MKRRWRALERRREGLQVEGEQENQSVSKGAKKGAGGCADSAAAFLANTYVLAEHDGRKQEKKRRRRRRCELRRGGGKRCVKENDDYYVFF